MSMRNGAVEVGGMPPAVKNTLQSQRIREPLLASEGTIDTDVDRCTINTWYIDIHPV